MKEMMDSIRKMNPQVVDVLRVILNRQPERATMERRGEEFDYSERMFNIAFCAVSEETIVAAERRTGVKKGVIVKAVKWVEQRRDEVKKMVLASPEAYQEVAYLYGITEWPLYEQDELREGYRRACISPEELKTFLEERKGHQLFPEVASEWLQVANARIESLKMEKGNLVERMCLAHRILEDDAAYVRISNLLAGPPPTSDTRCKPILDMPIEDLEFSVRTYNCLRKEGVNTLSALAQCTKERLAQIRNWGSRSQAEVEEVLERNDLL